MPIPAWVLALGGAGLLGSLFGDGRQPDIQTISTLTPEQRRIAASLADLIGGQIGMGLTPYGGALAAPVTPLQVRAAETISGLLGRQPLQGLPGIPDVNLGPLRSTVEPALSRVLSAEPTFRESPQETEQWFRTAVEAPAMRSFEQEILPRTREQFVGSGTFWSSMRAQAEANAARDLASALAAQRGQVQMAEREAGRRAAEAAAQRAAGALPAALSYALQAPMVPFTAALQARQQLASEQLAAQEATRQAAQLAFGMGETERQAQQQALQAAYQEWLRTRPEQSPYLQMAFQYLGIPMLAAYQPPYQPSPWAQLLGIAGRLATGYLMGA